MKHKLLKIANELNELAIHSYECVSIELDATRYENVVTLSFWHFSHKYENGCSYIFFLSTHPESELMNRFELAKKVIKGEELIND